jgi:xylan 1,4-beta-xylosidase
MAGLMQGDRVEAISSGAVSLDTMQQKGVREAPDTDVLATRAPGEAAVMVWNYQDDDVPRSDAAVTVTIHGLPAPAHRVLLQEYRIDEHHSNAYTVWKEMGSPQEPTPEQYARLQAAGHLQLLDSPRWITAEDRAIKVELRLPQAALSLLRVTYAER